MGTCTLMIFFYTIEQSYFERWKLFSKVIRYVDIVAMECAMKVLLLHVIKKMEKS